MNGSSVHALKLVDKDGHYIYAKFTWKSHKGEHNLRPSELPVVQKNRQQCYRRPLCSDCCQKFSGVGLIRAVDQAGGVGQIRVYPLYATKVWTGVPERKVGTMTLNRLPGNFFESTEQSAFAPGNLVPGIEASEDRLLQGRLFAYLDTQLHGVGTNFQALPTNRPLVPVVNNNQDGAANASGRTGSVNYEPSAMRGCASGRSV